MSAGINRVAHIHLTSQNELSIYIMDKRNGQEMIKYNLSFLNLRENVQVLETFLLLQPKTQI